MDLNKKLIDQLSDLSRNIKSLTSEVRENKSSISSKIPSGQKEGVKEEKKIESTEEQNKNFLKSLEDIFKKGISEMVKSNTKSNNSGNKAIEAALNVSSLKDKSLNTISPEVKLPKDIENLLGKLPKFAEGGTMNKDGLAVVGEKGPEVVKLNKGDKVIQNSKSKDRDRIEAELLGMELEDRDREMDKYRNSIKNNPDSSIKTADQKLSPPPNKKLNENSTLDDVKAKLLQGNPGYYKKNPEELEYDSKRELENLKEKRETFTLEDVQKLSKPVKTEVKSEEVKSQEPSKKELIKKEKEDRKKKKEEYLLKRNPEKKESGENKKEEELLNEKSDKKELGEEKKENNLLDKGKSFLKEKGVLEKGKNLLLGKGKDIITGKMSLGDMTKNPASLLGDKSQLLEKGMGASISLLSNKGLREKGKEKLKGLKKEKEEEKSSMSTESSELKKPKPEIKKEETKVQEEVKTEKKENPQKEIKKQEEISKPEEKKSSSNTSISEKSGKTEKGRGDSDMNDIKSLLGKIASLLEGPLTIETGESPFRPDSRRF